MLPSAHHFRTLSLTLPEWVQELVRPGMVYAGREERMRLAIGLALQNVAARTGGPFGAAVFEAETGRVVAVGVNVVVPANCSLAHAEAMAVALAQQALGRTTWPRRGCRAWSWDAAPSRAASASGRSGGRAFAAS